MNTKTPFNYGLITVILALALTIIGCTNPTGPTNITADTAITSAAVTITGPVKGAAPVTTAPAGGTGYTCGAVSWSPKDNLFKGGTVYTAAVTLTANSGYTFTGQTAAFVNNQAAIVSGYGKSVTLLLTFSATDPDDTVHTHDWGDWIQTKAPTETEDGEETRTCTICGEKETRAVAALNHIHQWGVWTQTTPPTCTEAGEETMVCLLNAAHIETRTGAAAIGHNYGNWTQTTAPTCTTDGIETRICSHNSSHTETRPGAAATGHDWGAWIVTTAPTATASGIETRTCTHNAAHQETRIIPATGGPNHEHIWGAWTITAPADCTNAGVETRTCSLDSTHQETRPIEALGHNWGAWIQTTAPTCTTTGEDTRICAHDSSHIETRTGATALGHDWGEWVQTSAPTCTESGEETRTCSHDPTHKETRPIEALGHNWGEWTQTTAPTCTTAGVETRICSLNSSHTETRTGTAALAHDWGDWVEITAPTVTNDGVETRTCKRDANHTEDRIIPATGIRVDPTVTWPQGLVATYGQTLWDISLAAYTNGGGTPGAFSWARSFDHVGSVGTQSHSMTFTPTDTAYYNTLTQNVSITVNKALGTFYTYALNTTYTPTLTLAALDAQLWDGYVWVTPSTSLDAGDDQSFAAIYTDPSGNYESATGTIMVNVAKATGATVDAPTTATIGVNSVTLNAVSASTGQSVEYAINSTNTAPSTGWQTGATFGGLNAGTTYYFFARSTEDSNYETGTPSAGAPITTKQQAGNDTIITYWVDDTGELSVGNGGQGNTVTVPNGGSVTFTANGAGYSNQRWTLNGNAVGSGATYTFDTADNDKEPGRNYLIGLMVQKDSKYYFTEITVRIE